MISPGCVDQPRCPETRKRNRAVGNDEILILIVDDSPHVRVLAGEALAKQGYRIAHASDGIESLEQIQKEHPDLVLMDINMPKMDGIEALREIVATNPALPVIMMSAQLEIGPAVDAMKLGARDYIIVPFNPYELMKRVERVINEISLKREVSRLETMLGNAKDVFKQMGQSPQIRALHEQLERVARTDFTVIIYGESGSGKELVARAIHQNSRRADEAFIAVDCGSIPENLIESELFGHERGAFTGAYDRKLGSFERASGGTLFLDEIGNLPKTMQSKLLRALQERKIERVGGTGPIPVDIRVIVAGNRRIQDLIAEGTFREDLFHRLNEFMIEIPPLRRRKDDLIYLADRFIKETAQELKKKPLRLSSPAVQLLQNYEWPGNVRELRNVIRRAVLLTDSDQIRPEHLTAINTAAAQLIPPVRIDMMPQMPLKEMMRSFTREIEQKIIEQAIEKAQGNKSKAAKLLQIDYKTMLTKIKEYKLGTPRRSALPGAGIH